MLGNTWKLVTPETIGNGFRKAGIHPFDRSVIPDEKYDPHALERWRLSKNNPSGNVTPAQNENEAEQHGLPENHMLQETSGKSADNQQNSEPSCSYRFEDILLQTVKQAKSLPVKQPRKKIASGAEVITAMEVKKRQDTNTSAASKKKKILGTKKSKKQIILESESDSDSEPESEPKYIDTEDEMDGFSETYSEPESEPKNINTDDEMDEEVLLLSQKKK